MMHKYTYLFFLVVMLSLSFTVSQQNSPNKDVIQLLTTQKVFESGTAIVLKFASTIKQKPNLYCSNSYGSVLIAPSSTNKTLHYKIPKTLYRKSGIVTWKLLIKKTQVSGSFYITPKEETARIESYIGPPTIEAGKTDYSMLVVIPTDANDNPLKDSTQVNIKCQFLAARNISPIFTSNLFAYKNIYSEVKIGRILISSESHNVNSKEYDVNVLPAIPTNFNISYTRNHDFADNNQFTTFSTSIIRDKYNNTVSDGTFVDFFITTIKGNRLKAAGVTVNGIAKAKMIHPDQDETWRVKAFVEGMAESNTIVLTFNQVIKNFDVTFSKNNRIITVGPLQSFMSQIIPDGFQVKLSIYHDDIIETFIESTFEGFVRFNLNKDQFPNNPYSFKIETAGIEKSFQTITVW